MRTTIKQAQDKAFKLTGKRISKETAKKLASVMDKQKRDWKNLNKKAEILAKESLKK